MKLTRTMFGAIAVLAAPATALAQEETPRGLAPLALLQKSFRTGTVPGKAGLESIRDLLRAHPEPEVAFLFTTFGTTYDNAAVIVGPLCEEGVRPRVTIYLLNGPGRRNESRRPHIDFYPSLKPDAFNRKLRDLNDRTFVGDLQKKIVAPTRAFIEAMNARAKATGKALPKFVLIPELEDNFGHGKDGVKAFGNLLGLVKQGLAGVSNVAYRRNPLPEGAPLSAFRIAGLPIENHSYQAKVLDSLKKGDSLTGDGAYFNYPTETGSDGPPIMINEPVIKFDALKDLTAKASRKGVGFLLWRPEWQGLAEGASGDPAKRQYSFPAIGTRHWAALRDVLHLGVKGKLKDPVLPKKPTSVTVVKPKGTKFDGGEGFLWKPVSDSDRRLVILCPTKLTDRILEVSILDANGKRLDGGRFTDVGNGRREHWRFPKAGRDYPRGAKAQLFLADGTAVHYEIPDPSQRYD